jgi:hypothetical protein
MASLPLLDPQNTATDLYIQLQFIGKITGSAAFLHYKIDICVLYYCKRKPHIAIILCSIWYKKFISRAKDTSSSLSCVALLYGRMGMSGWGDVRMWGCAHVKMRRCGDGQMGGFGDV